MNTDNSGEKLLREERPGAYAPGYGATAPATIGPTMEQEPTYMYTHGPAPVMNPDPWNNQPAPGYTSAPGPVDEAPAYHSGVPPVAAAGQPGWTEGERPVSGGDLNKFFAEENLYRMTPHVKVEYEEVFKEAEGANSFDVIATISGLVFKWTQLGVYRVFSVILGILLVFLWGILFALINFVTVFIMQPTIKFIFIILRPLAMLFKAIVRSFKDPFWQSFGLIFSRIMGRFSFNFKGLPGQKPTNQAAIKEV